MESKFSINLSGWQTSLLFHLLVLVLGVFILWLPKLQPDTVNIQILDAPSQVNRAPTIKMSAKPIQNARDKPRAIFGAPRKSVGSAESPQVKTGNTLAKESDSLELRPDDAESLPIPTEDYLVTSMPVIENEFRIPYPPEAKKNNISGVVVMDLLIDKLGIVREVKLFSGPGGGLNEAAMEAVKNFRFIPATIQDQAVAVRIRYGYRFVLEK